MRIKQSLRIFNISFLFVALLSISATVGFSAPPNPLKGYNIHVTATHIMDGEVIGPFHHYCKPINLDIIQCIIFESTDENARLTEVEYMVSKKLARSIIPQWSHTKNWHDHKQEIETGRVVIMNPSDPKEQKELAEYVADTDGIIFHLWPNGAPIPDGSVSIAQSVGHWEALHGLGETSSAGSSAKSSSSGGGQLSAEDFKRMGITEMSGR